MKSKFLSHLKRTNSRNEINTLSSVIDVEDKDSFCRRAQEIAFFFLQSHELINPITLARSSCYIALKEVKSEPEAARAIETIRHNNGQENKWFMHLVPIIEKGLPT